MKVPALRVPVCIFFLVFGNACSKEDQASEVPPWPKVVQAITPLPEPQDLPAVKLDEKAEAPGEEKPPRPLDASQEGATDTGPEEPPRADKPQAPVVEESETLAKVEQAQAGMHVVGKGETLAGIAGRQEIMQDPLKWLILLQMNLDKLGDQPIAADFAARELPPGTRLRFVTPGAAMEKVEKPSKPMWVVNVMSASAVEELVPPAIVLAREGYPVYITRAYVRGKDYLRLRVGFFPSKGEAARQGEKIKKLLGVEEFWAAKVDDVEYLEVAGFLKTP